MTIGLVMLVSGMVSGNPASASLSQLNTPNLRILAQAVSTDQSQVDMSASASSVSSDTTDSASTTDNTSDNGVGKTNKGLQQEIRAYFADIPLMAQISQCESQFRQYDPDGTIFRGKVNNNDVGVMQINETYHLKRAEKLGYDIYTVEGNLGYARLLYEEQGAKPWISSSPCWGKSAGSMQNADNKNGAKAADQNTTTSSSMVAKM